MTDANALESARRSLSGSNPEARLNATPAPRIKQEVRDDHQNLDRLPEQYANQTVEDRVKIKNEPK